MCTIVILRRPREPWPFIMAANRDEMAGRSWKAPGRHWPDRDHVVAGLDETAGGSWLGLNDDGVVAGVMNRPHTLGPAKGHRSRGELPLEALDHATAEDAAEALSHLDAAAYRPFNLIVADARHAFWVRAAGDEDDTATGGIAQAIDVKPIPEGLSMITAHDLDDAASPRLAFHRPRFAAAPAPDPERDDWGPWPALMASREAAHDAGPSGAMTVVTGTGFGTVSSSLIALPALGRFGVKPKFLFAAGRPGEALYRPISL